MDFHHQLVLGEDLVGNPIGTLQVLFLRVHQMFNLNMILIKLIFRQ